MSLFYAINYATWLGGPESSYDGDDLGTDMPQARPDETKKEVLGEPTEDDIDGNDSKKTDKKAA